MSFLHLRRAVPPPKLFNIENRLLSFKSVEHSIPIRIYKVSDQPTPLLIYLHGGGWSLGSFNTHDTLCRMLSTTANCTIVSMGYRLAPEHPYPSAMDDICLVYNWCHKNAQEINIAANKIAIGGESSGGSLAAAFTAVCVEENLPLPNFQVILYPTLDLNLNQQSMTDFGTGYFLTKNEMKYYRTNYAANLDVTDWHISPLRYPLFHKLPPQQLS